MRIATVGLDIAKSFKCTRQTQKGESFCADACGGIKSSVSLRTYRHAWLAWKLAVRRTTGFSGSVPLVTPVRLMAPQFVKPYVKSNKNDANDAEAICEAVRRPNMRVVPAKPVEQQDIQSLHRVRSRLLSLKTGLANQIRGFLSEYGIVLPQYVSQLQRGLPMVFTTMTDASDFHPCPKMRKRF